MSTVPWVTWSVARYGDNASRVTRSAPRCHVARHRPQCRRDRMLASQEKRSGAFVLSCKVVINDQFVTSEPFPGATQLHATLRVGPEQLFVDGPTEDVKEDGIM